MVVCEANHAEDYDMRRQCLKTMEREDLVVSLFPFLHSVATRPQTVCAAVHQCHPWISNADTHSTWRIYNRVAITHLLHRVSQERNKYDKYGLRPSKTITAEDLEDK